MRVNSLDDEGQSLPLRPDGSIEVESGGFISVNGRGFTPRSEAVVWIFSTPTRLGVVPVSITGEYSGKFSLGSEFEIGEHTVQVNGVAESGEIRSMNLDLVIIEPKTENAAVVTTIASIKGESGDQPAPLDQNSDSPVPLFVAVLIVVLGAWAIYLVGRRQGRRKSLR